MALTGITNPRNPITALKLTVDSKYEKMVDKGIIQHLVMKSRRVITSKLIASL